MSVLTLFQKIQHNFDRQLLLVWLFIFPALSPLIQSTLPRSADGLLHLYRIVALDQALQQGAIFPRWLPDLAYGYGLPLFVFYAPLTYYLTELPYALGFDIITAINLSFIAALLVASTGVYLFIRDHLGPQAGLVAAIAYIYAPYQLFNVFVRGSFPAVWAAALFPLAFWAFNRLFVTTTSRWLVISAFLSALAILTHNISSLLFFPVLGFYLGVIWLFEFKQATLSFLSRMKKTGVIAGALLLGIGMATFFWLPAMLERDFVQIERVITPPDFDYRAHFVHLADLFVWPDPTNTGLFNPEFPFTLGLPQVILAGLGLIGLLLRVTLASSKIEYFLPQIKVMLFASIGFMVTLFMMLPISVWVWDRLPLIAFVQHPHRLLGVAAFLLATAAGAFISLIPTRWQLGGTVVSVSLIFIGAIPLLYPRYYDPLPAEATLSGMFDYEYQIGAIGTTSFGEYVPIWVSQLPQESPIQEMYLSGQSPERLDVVYLPEGASVTTTRYAFNDFEFELNAPEAYQAIFHTFYFPGWTAWLNGEMIATAPVTERGLLSVPMPAGQHTLRLTFQETPARRWANGISFVAIGIGLGLLFWRQQNLSGQIASKEKLVQLPSREWLTLGGLAVGLILAKGLYLDRFDSPFKQSFDGAQVKGIDQPLQVNFRHELKLLGYDLPDSEIEAGETFDLTAYWQTTQNLSTDYSILAQLVDENKNLYASQDNLHPGQVPLRRWEPWHFGQDPHSIRVPFGTPPGQYFLITGPYHPETWSRLAVVEGDQPNWPDVFAIPVTVNRSTQTPSITDLEITWLLSSPVSFGLLQLLGASPERETIPQNNIFRFALFWQATKQPDQNYAIHLRLVDEAGNVTVEQDIMPSHNRYPTSEWTEGEIVRDNQALWVSSEFEAGRYQVEVRLLDEDGGPMGEWEVLGEVIVVE